MGSTSEATFDEIPPTSIVASLGEESLDFRYGAEPKWLILTIRGANDSETTGLGVPGTYDGPLRNKANPTIEEIKEFFAD